MPSILTECINNIANYLEVKIGKITEDNNVITCTVDNETIIGFTNIIFHLINNSQNSILRPQNDFGEIQIRQIIEYVLVYISRATNNPQFNFILKDLNGLLATRTYLIEHSLTIADLLLYYALVRIVSNLSNLDKEKYVNVSRWLDNIQQDAKIRQKNELINFSTNYLI